tara:strand:+ start:143 stop:487 length:345 start_codon:yes stop_codon:yes gene_type:complete
MKGEEILTCLILVAIGYFIAKMFSRTCNGFRVGGMTDPVPICDSITNSIDSLINECEKESDCRWDNDIKNCYSTSCAKEGELCDPQPQHGVNCCSNAGTCEPIKNSPGLYECVK